MGADQEPPDDGSGTVLVLVAGAVLLTTGAAALTGTQVVDARRSLADTADLVAIAGAATTGDPATRCRSSAAIAQANHAALDRCSVAPDGTVGVTVDRAVRLPLISLARTGRAAPLRLDAAARAGPGEVSGRAAGP
jgi:secretion/DNA translocation related TadE-like protein